MPGSGDKDRYGRDKVTMIKQKHKIGCWFSTEGDFLSFLPSPQVLGWGAIGMQWVEAVDAAKSYSAQDSLIPSQQRLSGPKVNSVTVKTF